MTKPEIVDAEFEVIDEAPRPLTANERIAYKWANTWGPLEKLVFLVITYGIIGSVAWAAHKLSVPLFR